MTEAPSATAFGVFGSTNPSLLSFSAFKNPLSGGSRASVSPTSGRTSSTLVGSDSQSQAAAAHVRSQSPFGRNVTSAVTVAAPVRPFGSGAFGGGKSVADVSFPSSSSTPPPSAAAAAPAAAPPAAQQTLGFAGPQSVFSSGFGLASTGKASTGGLSASSVVTASGSAPPIGAFAAKELTTSTKPSLPTSFSVPPPLVAPGGNTKNTKSSSSPAPLSSLPTYLKPTSKANLAPPAETRDRNEALCTPDDGVPQKQQALRNQRVLEQLDAVQQLTRAVEQLMAWSAVLVVRKETMDALDEVLDDVDTDTNIAQAALVEVQSSQETLLRFGTGGGSALQAKAWKQVHAPFQLALQRHKDCLTDLAKRAERAESLIYANS